MILIKHKVTGAILAELGGTSLAGEDLRDMDLAGADLSGQDLSGANLEYSDLTEADLSQPIKTKAHAPGSTYDTEAVREWVKEKLQ